MFRSDRDSLLLRLGAPSIAVFLALPSSAQSLRISAPLEREVVGKVLSARASANGQRVVYQVDPSQRLGPLDVRASIAGDEPQVPLGLALGHDFQLDSGATRVFALLPGTAAHSLELFVAPGDASEAPRQLSGPMVENGRVIDYRLSADENWIVYRADQEVNEHYELYAVPSAGGVPVKVNTPLAASDDVLDFVIGPNSRSVFYRVRRDQGAIDLYVGSVRGRQPARRINAAHGAGREVRQFALAPDGHTLVYLADSLVDDVFELFRAPAAAGAAPQRISAPSAAGRVFSFAIAPDGKRVVYLANHLALDRNELFSVLLDGSQPALHLNGPLAPGGDVSSILIAPDSRSVAYLADASVAGQHELHGVAIDGSTPARKLCQVLQAGDQVAADFLWDAASAHLAYVLQQSFGLQRVFSAALDGSRAPVELSGELLASAAPRLRSDGTRIVFESGSGIVSARIDASEPPRVLAPAGTLADLSSSGTVLFRATSASGPLAIDLFQVPLTGGAAARINPQFQPGPVLSDVRSFAVSPLGDRACYVVDHGFTGNGALFTVKMDGRGRAERIDDPARELGGFSFSPDGRWILVDEDGQLTSVEAQGSGARHLLAARSFAARATPDSSHVLFFRQTSVTFDLYAARIDGSTAPVRLDGMLFDTWSTRVTPDSKRAVYTADFELSSVLVDGSAAPIRLSGALAPGEWVPAFELAPDGQRVVYTVEPIAGGTSELYSTLVDGSALPLHLATSGTFAIDATSTRVVFSSAGSLFMVPITGGAPRALNPFEPTPVDGFELTPDGRRVVYWTDMVMVTPFTHFFGHSVPIDGSSAPVLLSAEPLVSTVMGAALPISPDGRWVVLPTDTRLESIRVDGSGGAHVLVPDYDPATGFEDRVRFTPDGAQALYLTRHIDRIALDGSQPPQRLDGPGIPDGGVAPGFEVLRDGSGVVYIADQEVLDRFELFVGGLGHGVRGASVGR